MPTFFDRFSALCKERGETPNSLGKKLGISSGSITAWKNGTIPRMKTLDMLARHFHVSVDYLIGNAEEALMTVGERIKNARKEAGCTQKQLSEKSGVSTVSIQQYERGVRQPRLEQLKKLADALDISFVSFFNYFKGLKDAKEDREEAKKEQISYSALKAYLQTMYGVCEPRQFTCCGYAFNLLVCGIGDNEIVIEDDDFYAISCAVQGLISSMVSCLGRSIDAVQAELSALNTTGTIEPSNDQLI